MWDNTHRPEKFVRITGKEYGMHVGSSHWAKSSRSYANGACLEVTWQIRNGEIEFLVRNSRRPEDGAEVLSV